MRDVVSAPNVSVSGLSSQGLKLRHVSFFVIVLYCDKTECSDLLRPRLLNGCHLVAVDG